jgi:hypothetical protein
MCSAFGELGFEVTVVDRLAPGMAEDEPASLAVLRGRLGAGCIPCCVLGEDSRRSMD